MLIRTLIVVATLLPTGGPGLAMEGTDGAWTAEIRRYSPAEDVLWNLRLHESREGKLDASLWWIEGAVVHAGMPERIVRASGRSADELPDLLHARTAEVTHENCVALTEAVAAFRRLTLPEPKPTTRGNGAEVFELKTPKRNAIDLMRLDRTDPLAIWAQRAWEQVSTCADRDREE